MEAFNLTEYFNSLGGDEDTHDAQVQKSLDDIKKIVLTTLEAMDRRAEVSFQFHSGANLLVMVGSAETSKSPIKWSARWARRVPPSRSWAGRVLVPIPLPAASSVVWVQP